MHGLEPTSKLIIEEAQRRGIAVEILAPRAEYFRLRHSGRMLLCRESLSELATGVAVSRCDDQHITWRMLQSAGLPVPAQVEAASEAQNTAFLREHGCDDAVAACPGEGKRVGEGELDVAAQPPAQQAPGAEEPRLHRLRRNRESGRCLLDRQLLGYDLIQ